MCARTGKGREYPADAAHPLSTGRASSAPPSTAVRCWPWRRPSLLCPEDRCVPVCLPFGSRRIAARTRVDVSTVEKDLAFHLPHQKESQPLMLNPKNLAKPLIW